MESKKIQTAVENVAIKPDYAAEIINIIRSSDTPKSIMNRLDDYHGNDIADVLELLSVQERKKFYRVSSADMLADIFEYLDDTEAGCYLNEMDIRRAAVIVSKLDTDTAVEILKSIGKEKRTLIIEALPEENRNEIQLIASFDEDEIGSRMTTNYIILHEDMSIKQAMSELIRQAEENDNIATLFVVDENNVYSGAVDLKDLITARNGKPLHDLIAASFPYVYATEQTLDCIEKLKDYS